MNEKNLMKTYSAEENAEPRVEGTEDGIAKEKSADQMVKDALEKAEDALEDATISTKVAEDVSEGAGLDYENAEPYAEDAEDRDLAFEDEEVLAEEAEGSTESEVGFEENEVEDYLEEAEGSTESEVEFAEGAEDLEEDMKVRDLEELKKSFPELAGLGSTEELQHPEKYQKFRALGLTPKEAFLATGQVLKPKRSIPSSPISVSRQRDGIPNRELKFAREIFPGLCDKEIQELYRKVAK